MQMPVSEDALGRWLEDNNSELSIQCTLGIYAVTVSWGKLHAYSDERGAHRETWRVSRHDKNLPKAMHEALTEAMRQTEVTK